MSADGPEIDNFDKFLDEFDAELKESSNNKVSNTTGTAGSAPSVKEATSKLITGIPLPTSPPEIPKGIGRRRNSKTGSESSNPFMASLFGEDSKPNLSSAPAAMARKPETRLNTRPSTGTPGTTTASSTIANRPASPVKSTPRYNSAAADWLGLGPENNSGRNSPSASGGGDDSPNLRLRTPVASNLGSSSLSQPSKISSTTNEQKPKSILQTTRSKFSHLEDTDDFFHSLGIDENKKIPSVTTSNKRVVFEDSKQREPKAQAAGQISFSGTGTTSMEDRSTYSKNIFDSGSSSNAAYESNISNSNNIKPANPSKTKAEELKETSSPAAASSSFSLLDDLPFLKKKPGTATTKKAVTKKKSVTTKDEDGTNSSTRTHNTHNKLEIPVHIIDEDELKTMSSSMKLLYCNQLELLENSYKEQIYCLTQSHQRKEEILKDEIRTMQKDYEERLHRMKVEVQEGESTYKSTKKSQQHFENEFEMLTNSMNQLKSLIQSQTNSLENPNAVSLEKVLSPLISTQLIPALSSDLKQSLEKLTSSGNYNETGASETQLRLKEVSDNLNALNLRLKNTDFTSNGQKVDEKLQGIDKRVDSEFQNLIKLQKKHRDTIIKNILSSVTNSMESKINENENKKEQIKSQLKEFRKDFKKIMKEFETGHQNVNKSQKMLETEQKQIAQSLQNLNQWLQMNWTKQTATNMGLLSANGGIGDGGGLGVVGGQQQQSLHNSNNSINGLSLQTELELKLLREERHNLTEAITQLNVEKRKLNDEKIILEQDKYRIEHERNRIMELETMLKLKSNDLEDIKMRAETARQEYVKLTTEFNRKLKEFEYDSDKQKETIEYIEQKFRSKEIKLQNEKYEVQKDKEFLEKLRVQMLCPNCLQLNPEPSIHFRSRGDGLEYGGPNATNTTLAAPPPNSYFYGNSIMPGGGGIIGKDFVGDGIATLLNRERKYLNNMYLKYFMSAPTKE